MGSANRAHRRAPLGRGDGLGAVAPGLDLDQPAQRLLGLVLEDAQPAALGGARQPMLFAGGTKGIALDRDALTLKVVDVADGDWQGGGVIVHDVTNRSVAHMLVEMPFGEFPMALGVLYDDPRPTFESQVIAQNKAASEGKSADLGKLLAKGQTWTVAEGHPEV